MAVQLLKRLFTVDEYHAMARAGILSEDDRVELIEGEVVQMAPIGNRHAACVRRLNDLFHRHLADTVLVDVQNPLRLSAHSEPQPDIVLLRRREDFYADVTPTPTDALLVIEVADSSAIYDREIKAPLYAQWRVAELWVVDLVREVIESFRVPSPQAYQQIVQFQRGQVIAPQAFPDVQLSVDAILG